VIVSETTRLRLFGERTIFVIVHAAGSLPVFPPERMLEVIAFLHLKLKVEVNEDSKHGPSLCDPDSLIPALNLTPIFHP
jgi:hypothetical protein